MHSVQGRKRNIHSFIKEYSHQCTLHNVIPDASIKVGSNNVLDVTGDRLKLNDWKPLLETIRNDKSLHYICIRSSHTKYRVIHHSKKGISDNRFTPKSSPSFMSSTIGSILESSTSKETIKSQMLTPKSSPSFTTSTTESFKSLSSGYKTSYLTKKESRGFTPKLSPLVTNTTICSITDTLSTCLMQSQTLTGLLLENIILGSDSLKLLLRGLEVSKSLQQLSLPFTQIGDEGCFALCHILRGRLNLVWINLTGCNLTNVGIDSICKLIKFQKLNRYGESWKQSLRYRNVNPNVMPGLRRITLCHNAIGDAGVQLLVETLIDDLWVKAVDLQDCEMTSLGGKEVLSLVTENRCLNIVDIRSNKELPSLYVEKVTEILMKRSTSEVKDFQWLKEDGINYQYRGNTTCRSAPSPKSNLQKLYSNTAFSILPNKLKKMLPNDFPTSVHFTRLCSSKSIPNQKNRMPQSFRRGKSDTNVSNKKSQLKIADLDELKSLKEELKNMSIGVNAEVNKRSKIEKELQEFKTIVENSKSKEKDSDKDVNDAKHDENNGNKLNGSNSLESLIQTLNGGNTSVSLPLQHVNCGNEAGASFSKPYLIFETLLSS